MSLGGKVKKGSVSLHRHPLKVHLHTEPQAMDVKSTSNIKQLDLIKNEPCVTVYEFLPHQDLSAIREFEHDRKSIHTSKEMAAKDQLFIILGPLISVICF